MTPVEKPNPRDKRTMLGLLEKKTTALPIPVQSPANKVKPKAIRTLFSISRVARYFRVVVTAVKTPDA